MAEHGYEGRAAAALAEQQGPAGRRESGDDDRMSAKLYLPNGVDGGGYLHLAGLPGDEELVVDLTAKLIRPIVALSKARQADRAVIRCAKGWRRAEQLVEIIAGLSPRFIALTPATVRSYLSEIGRAIRLAAKAHGLAAPPRLLEFRRCFGCRLATDRIEIIHAGLA